MATTATATEASEAVEELDETVERIALALDLTKRCLAVLRDVAEAHRALEVRDFEAMARAYEKLKP
jgi:hypothetical protein